MGERRRRERRRDLRPVAQRVALKPLTLGTLALSAAMVALFGQGASDLGGLSMLACAAGFFTNAAIVGLYSIFARTFPTHVRAAGTGFAIGVGRGGAALSPWIAGLLFEGGFALPQVAGAMACGSVLAFGALLFLRFRDADGSAHGSPRRHPKDALETFPL